MAEIPVSLVVSGGSAGAAELQKVSSGLDGVARAQDRVTRSVQATGAEQKKEQQYALARAKFASHTLGFGGDMVKDAKMGSKLGLGSAGMLIGAGVGAAMFIGTSVLKIFENAEASIKRIQDGSLDVAARIKAATDSRGENALAHTEKNGGAMRRLNAMGISPAEAKAAQQKGISPEDLAEIGGGKDAIAVLLAGRKFGASDSQMAAGIKRAGADSSDYMKQGAEIAGLALNTNFDKTAITRAGQGNWYTSQADQSDGWKAKGDAVGFDSVKAGRGQKAARDRFSQVSSPEAYVTSEIAKANEKKLAALAETAEHQTRIEAFWKTLLLVTGGEGSANNILLRAKRENNTMISSGLQAAP